MATIKKLAGQTAIYGLSSIVGRFLNYLLVPIYTRIFVPAEYGVVSEMYAYVTFLMVLYTYGMETAYFHFSEKHKKGTSQWSSEEVYSNGLFSLVSSSILFSGVLILFSQTIAAKLGYSNHANYIQWFAWILALDAVTSLPFARLRREGKAKRFVTIKIINILLNIGLNIFFLVVCRDNYLNHTNSIFNFYKPEYGVGYVFISNLISSFVTMLLLLPEMQHLRLKFNSELLKQMLLYSFPLLIAGFAGMINETFDRAVLKYLVVDKTSALQQLGIYSACYKLSILMTLFVQTFRYAAEPFFFSQQHKENSKELYARVMNYFVICCCVIFLVVMLYLDGIKYFIGPQYHAGLKVVPVLLVANMCLGVYLNLSMWYKLTGQTRYGAFFSVIGAIITIVFLFLLIPLLGYLGAAYATLICYASMMLISYFTGQRIYPIPYQWKKLLLYFGVALAIYFLSETIDHFMELHKMTRLLINTLLIFIYTGWVYKKEKLKGFAANNSSDLKTN